MYTGPSLLALRSTEVQVPRWTTSSKGRDLSRPARISPGQSGVAGGVAGGVYTVTADWLDFLSMHPSVTQGLQVPVLSICAPQEMPISPSSCLCGLPLLWVPHLAPSQPTAGSSPSLCLGVVPWSGVCPWPSDQFRSLGFCSALSPIFLKNIFIDCTGSSWPRAGFL